MDFVVLVTASKDFNHFNNVISFVCSGVYNHNNEKQI